MSAPPNGKSCRQFTRVEALADGSAMAVCASDDAVTVTKLNEQGEWDAMELSKPGYHTLIRGGIATEGEAERLARGPEAAPAPKARRS